MSFAAIAIAGTVASVGMGTAQMLSANKGRRRAELEAKAQNSPIYKPSKAIQSYYQEAMNRYQESPFQTQQYQVGAQNIRRGMASGVAGLQDRRSAIGGINRLAASEANAMQNLAASAEGQRAQRFGQLGQASQAMAGEQRMEFDINKQTPYNRNLQLAQWRAQTAADQEQAGLSTIGTGLSNLATFAAYQGAGAQGASSNVNAQNMTGSQKILRSPNGNYSSYSAIKGGSLIPKTYYTNP
jgi:hypothetical protein